VALVQSWSNKADASTIHDAFVAVHEAGNLLRDITPGSGAYQNEADVYEPDPVGTFWGAENYQKLSAIKAELDPHNIVTCRGCIGWDQSDPRYGCYPDIDD
jgi:FAD/FMN-containing dehydrogenase